eukprot:PhF_6_TR37871/c0_g1_i1/m.56477
MADSQEPVNAQSIIALIDPPNYAEDSSPGYVPPPPLQTTRSVQQPITSTQPSTTTTTTSTNVQNPLSPPSQSKAAASRSNTNIHDTQTSTTEFSQEETTLDETLMEGSQIRERTVPQLGSDHVLDILWRLIYLCIAIVEYVSLMSALSSCVYSIEPWLIGVFTTASVASVCHVAYSFNKIRYDVGGDIPFGLTTSEVAVNRRNYIQSWFCVDLVLSLPFDLFALRRQSSDALFVSIFRVLRLTRIPGLVFRGPRRHRIHSFIIVFVIFYVLWTHTLACVRVISMGCVESFPYISGLYYAVGVTSIARYNVALHDLNNTTYNSTTEPSVDIVSIVAAPVTVLGTLLFWGYFCNRVVFGGSGRSSSRASHLVKFLHNCGVSTQLQREALQQYEIVSHVTRTSSFLSAESNLSVCVNHALLRCVKISYLRRTKTFSHLPQNCIDALAETMTHTTYANKQVVAEIGDAARGMIVLVDGVLEVENSNGEIIGLLQPGAWFGESCLVQPSIRIARVTAVTRVMVLSLLRDDVIRLGEEYPDIISCMPQTPLSPQGGPGFEEERENSSDKEKSNSLKKTNSSSGAGNMKM